MNDLSQLIQERTQALDRQRARAQKRFVYVFIGKRTAGEIARPPSRHTVRMVRESDPLPENTLRWGDSFEAIRAWYEASTERTGPNVRRWKKIGEGE